MKTAKEAKELLNKYRIRSIKPMQLAMASKQLDKSLIETLQIIAFMKGQGQGFGPFPHTMRALKGKYV